MDKSHINNIQVSINKFNFELIQFHEQNKFNPNLIESIFNKPLIKKINSLIDELPPDVSNSSTDIKHHYDFLTIHNLAIRLTIDICKEKNKLENESKPKEESNPVKIPLSIGEENKQNENGIKHTLNSNKKGLFISNVQLKTKILNDVESYLLGIENITKAILYNYSFIAHYNSKSDLILTKETEGIISTKAANAIDEINSIYNSISDKLNNTLKAHKEELSNFYKERNADVIRLIKDAESDAINRQDVRTRNVEKTIEILERSAKNAEEKFDESLRESIDQLMIRSRQSADKNIENINKSTNNSLKSITSEKDKTLSSFRETVQNEVSSINEKINIEVGEFENKKNEIIQILGDISTAHQSNANRNQADKEKVDADKFRKYGLIGLICVIFLSIWLFNDYIHIFGKPDGEIPKISELGISWFTLRFMTITLLTAPCIYMLKESASHRAKENLYRQRGTQLSSIGAYLDELRPEERAQMKKELATNFFSFHDGKADVSNVPDFLKNLGEAVKLANSIKTPSTEHTANTKEKEKV